MYIKLKQYIYPDWVLPGRNVVYFGIQLLTFCPQLPTCNLNSETLTLICHSKKCQFLVGHNAEAANVVCVGGNGKVITL